MCKWQSKYLPRYECKVPAEPGSEYCIFHEPGEKNVEKFKEKFYEQIDEVGPESQRNGRFDFRGYIFPIGIRVSSIAPDELGSSRVILPREIGLPLLCSESCINGDSSFDGAMINGDVRFDQAVINGRISFEEAAIEGDLSYVDARVKGAITYQSATINGTASFFGATIGGDALFPWVTIRGHVSFYGARIMGNALFFDGVLEEGADFDSVTIEGAADFTRAVIRGKTSFVIAVFSRMLELRDAAFEGEVVFGSCRAGGLDLGEGRPTILWSVLNRCGIYLRDVRSRQSFWRFARLTFESQGQRDRADAAHYFERVSRVSPRWIPLKGRWWRWRNRRALVKRLLILLFHWLPDCLFLRWPTAYGASLSRLFTTWGILTVGFGLVYYLLGARLFDPESAGLAWSLSFGRALYFSIITFTTLGYGDIRPMPGLGSALTATEAILGGIMMALTVLVIGRKFMR